MKVTINGQVIEPIYTIPKPVEPVVSMPDWGSIVNPDVAPIEWLFGFIGEKLKDGLVNFAVDFLTDFLSVFPIILVVAVGVRMLFGMFSKTLARWGTIGVFLYGAWIVLIH